MLEKKTSTLFHFGIAAAICAMLTSSLVFAESQPIETKSTPSTPAVSTDANQSEEEQEDNKQPTRAPQDTRGGVGLKDRKLSVIFEQFVPSETISADNAVPFPTDI